VSRHERAGCTAASGKASAAGLRPGPLVGGASGPPAAALDDRIGTEAFCRQTAVGADGRSCPVPSGWRGKREAQGRRRRQRKWVTVVRGPAAGRAGMSAAWLSHAAPSSELRAPRGCGQGGLRRGRFKLRDGKDRRRVAVRGWLRKPFRPPSTRVSRADHRPARQRPYVRQGPIDVAHRAAVRSHGGRVDGRRDGTPTFLPPIRVSYTGVRPEISLEKILKLWVAHWGRSHALMTRLCSTTDGVMWTPPLASICSSTFPLHARPRSTMANEWHRSVTSVHISRARDSRIASSVD